MHFFVFFFFEIAAAVLMFAHLFHRMNMYSEVDTILSLVVLVLLRLQALGTVLSCKICAYFFIYRLDVFFISQGS